MSDGRAVGTTAGSAPPLLTIAIPTFNRASYLAQGLAQLHAELRTVDSHLVEVIVSDNCSPDTTPAVVEDAVNAGLPIRYFRNAENLGWARNFVQCFEAASGRYVLMLGDDDLLVDGALAQILSLLEAGSFGVVCLRPFGFDRDFRREHPGGGGGDRVFGDANAFLLATSRFFTLTSANIVNKSLLAGVDPRLFIDSDLAVFHLTLRAALAGPQNLFVTRYLVASKRQNSFSYDYARVFVGDLWRIIDAHVPFGISPATVRRLERQKLLSYYPFYLFDLRVSRRGDPGTTYAQFAARFRGRALFMFWLAPIVRLPRPLAIAWGGLTTVVGRILGGDLGRGIAFLLGRLKRRGGAGQVEPQAS